jgi:hypothetical protein
MGIPRRIVLTVSVAAVCLGSVASQAATVKPTTGTFRGPHGFDGPISLVFASEDGIGLHPASFTFRGTLKCDAGESIPFSFTNRRVTSRTAARVRKGKFRHRAGDIIITGSWSRTRTVTGDVTLRSTPCTKTTGFVAKRR